MKWLNEIIESARLVPRPVMARVYVSNAIAAPVLWGLFLWSGVPDWCLMVFAVFVGAAWHNAAVGLALHSVLREYDQQ